MRFFTSGKSLLTAVFFLFLLATIRAAVPLSEAARSLPDALADWRAQTTAGEAQGLSGLVNSPEIFHIVSAATRAYVSADKNSAFKITLVRTRNETGAYSLLTALRSASSGAAGTDIGTASFLTPDGLVFYKGTSLVLLKTNSEQALDNETLTSVARALAQNLDNGEGEIPVLVKHLPDWEQAEPRASYYVSLPELQKAVGSSAEFFSALDFAGGTEAVLAPYGNTSRLLIVEHNSPQLAANNQGKVEEQLQKFRQEGKPLPSAYRRAGNYLVFVLDEPNAEAATALAGKVNYEQLVRWLGDNPHAFDKAQRLYSEKTANVIITTLKATALSLVVCLGIGAIFGGVVFVRRRSQQAVVAAYTDAGGMIRLNIDDLPTESLKANKLLSDGAEPL